VALSVGIRESSALLTELNAPVAERNLLAHGHLRDELYHSLTDFMEQMQVLAVNTLVTIIYTEFVVCDPSKERPHHAHRIVPK